MPRILLIEPSATIRHIEMSLLVRGGYTVEVDADFGSALTNLRNCSENGPAFDAVVVGWSNHISPGEDAFYLSLEEPAYVSLPVLAFAHEPDGAIAAWVERRPHTAFLLWEDFREATGILASLFIETDKLPRKSPDPVPADQEQPIRVLFVDDSATVRFKYLQLLTANGYHVETAASVTEGFAKALESQFDIAIIDYFMPDGTGDILCQRLREHTSTANITTSLITGTYLDKAIKMSLEAGAVECMFKNESDDLFLTRIGAMSRHIRDHKSIEKERERLSGILRSVGEGVYGVNSAGVISFVNPACLRILGYGPEEKLIGRSAMGLFHYADDEGNPVDEERSVLQQAYSGDEPVQARETLFWHKSGASIPIEFTVYPLTIEDKREGSVVAFRDISERKMLEEELRWQASHDALTKLFNRRHFEEQLANEADRLKRSREISALLYIDLDRFKYINDTAGHAAGDQLLVEIAQKLNMRLRKSDLLARLGGDEFAIILRNIYRQKVHQVADDYREMLDHFMFVYNGKQYKVNGTIGIALIDCNSESAGEILANADIACHIAKGEGRNRTHLFIPENDNKQAMDVDLGWYSRLHDALEKDHLVLQIQPIIPVELIPEELMLETEGPIYNQLRSVVPQEVEINELLLRLDDPAWGLVYPGAFLPTAERFNMMDKIDNWVINAALNKLAQLQHAGYKGAFTINLSGQTMADEELIGVIEDLVINLGINSSKVMFEITETSAVSNLVSANEMITKLSALGCRFALDDFGSGFSSFSHLKHLPVDFIKIDGMFVRGVATDPSDRAIVHSINDIAHSLGKKTIAEYVENAEVLQFLRESGVNYVQGHFISESIDFSNISSRVDGAVDSPAVSQSKSKSGSKSKSKSKSKSHIRSVESKPHD